MSRVYFYSHDGQGLGHLRRNLNIATAVSRKTRDVACLLLTGSQFPGLFRLPPRCDFVKIPTLRKTDADTYRPLFPHEFTDDIISMRAALLRTVVSQMPPDVLIVDRHAAGLGGELLPALHWLRKSHPACRIVLGLREVLDEPAVIEAEWARHDVPKVVRRFYDRVWIYGDARVFRTADVYHFPDAVRRKAAYCGYLLPRELRERNNHREKLSIVASVGGGADGYPLLESTIAALTRIRASAAITADLFAGPMMSKPQFEALRTLAAPYREMRVERFSPNYLRLLSSAHLVVTMGGYNSLSEAVSLGKRVIVVPRTEPRREQLIRARAFERLGLVRVIPPDDLTPRRLAQEMQQILETPPPKGRSAISFGATAEVVRTIRHILATGTISDV